MKVTMRFVSTLERIVTLLMLSALLCSSSVVSASTIEIWHGWMNLAPCSKVEWRNDGLFGTPSPTYIEAPQELHGWVRADVTDTTSDLINAITSVATNCAAQGATAAGTVALITGGPGAWETFVSTFKSCIANTSVARYIIQFRLDTDSQCNW